jgi:putative flavoprotein involved in K+ transport
MSDSAPTPTQQAAAWLADFGVALERADLDAALAMFDNESYWRDLVAFTWNITTMEGPDAIRAMLENTLAATKPSGWQIAGQASAANGVTECWLTDACLMKFDIQNG